MRTIEADYLVIGAGATGMAFIDTLVDETTASVVVVDRNHAPGGHWTTAYPFVRLHQPSAYYGVNSRKLGTDTIDRSGFNEGYYELAGGAEVCAYFDAVMQRQLLPTGRVSYFPMSAYLGDGRFRTLGGQDVTVTVRRRVVDTTKNAFCRPVLLPEVPLDWLRMMLAFNSNQLQWFADPEMMAWLDSARLNILSHATAAVSPRAREKIIGALGSRLQATNDKLEELLQLSQ